MNIPKTGGFRALLFGICGEGRQIYFREGGRGAPERGIAPTATIHSWATEEQIII
jgi:hypothetical protein